MKRIVVTIAISLAPGVAMASPPPATGTVEAQPQVPVIVNGIPVEACGWAPTLERGGCTASLIHPMAISTAQHCGPINSVVFTDAVGDASQTVGVDTCVDTGSEDARICLLDEPVDVVPPAPVPYGCEIDEYLTIGEPVVIAGFGLTAFGNQGSYGVKRWADQVITAVEPGRVIIGDPGDPISPCPGDSGGPVYLQVDDGSWRTIGSLLGGTTQTPCNSAANYQRLDPIVPNFEAQTGIDITPCFDASTGEWDPGPDCGGFYAGDHTGAGSSGMWSDWCVGSPASGYSDQCGAPFGGDGDGDGDPGDGDGDPGDGDGDPGDGDGDPGDGDGDGSSGSGEDEDGSDGTDGAGTETGLAAEAGGDLDGGCSCRTDARGSGLAGLLLLPLVGLYRRRRRTREAV